MSNLDTGFTFGTVVFFGRGIEEYIKMFNLDLKTMSGMKVLDCPAGPASFARQAIEHNIMVTACDPLYANDDVQMLRNIVDRDIQSTAKKFESNLHLFYDELVPVTERRKMMELFLEDYPISRVTGRYISGQLPKLPFNDQEFDISLSGNLLFLYSDTTTGGMMSNSPFDYEFHKEAIIELLRVCKNNVRLYPLQGPGVKEHTYLKPLMQYFTDAGLKVELQPVPQRDIIGAEQMLLISKQI